MRIPVAMMAGTMLVFCSVGQVTGASYTLYDDTLGNLPTNQGWGYAALLGAAIRTVVPGVGVKLQTDTSVQAGYSRLAPVPLDRHTGFRLSFELQIHEESHQNTDRAGFSMIALSSDRKGIELGFWSDAIWAQHDDSTGELFTHGETYVPDVSRPLSVQARYLLDVAADRYQLSVDGVPLLGGPVRDYTALVSLIDPYEVPNFLFLGDDSGNASADVTLGEVTLVTNTLVPLPPALMLMLSGLVVVGRFAGRPRQ